MSTNQPRRPAGTPAGGQWAPSRHDEAEVLQITRSRGIPAGYGGYVVGGGYRGATKELDDSVQDAASALAKRFGSVEIRFNTDRRSGGAWLVTNPGQNDITANTWIGVNASLVPAEADAPPSRAVKMGVYIKGEALKDPLSVDADTSGRRTFRQSVPDLDRAIELIEEKSVAGDWAEIERRRSLEASFGQREAELCKARENRFAKRTKDLPAHAPEREQIRKEELAEYEKGHAELVEQFWADVAHPKSGNKSSL
jgi:hypothetical protein